MLAQGCVNEEALRADWQARAHKAAVRLGLEEYESYCFPWWLLALLLLLALCCCCCCLRVCCACARRRKRRPRGSVKLNEVETVETAETVRLSEVALDLAEGHVAAPPPPLSERLSERQALASQLARV